MYLIVQSNVSFTNFITSSFWFCPSKIFELFQLTTGACQGVIFSFSSVISDPKSLHPRLRPGLALWVIRSSSNWLWKKPRTDRSGVADVLDFVLVKWKKIIRVHTSLGPIISKIHAKDNENRSRWLAVIMR